MAFLEVITRCFQRPVMLGHNTASLEAQTCDDWMQTLLIDEVGRGVGWANLNLASYAADLEGDYIWVLDDDDMAVRNTLVGELKQIAQQQQADVIMLKMNHMIRGILPDDDAWGKPPQCGRIGCSAYVVRRGVFKRHADAFKSAGYASDFDFISSIFEDEKVNIFWHDVIASQVQRISLGLPELT